MKKIQIVAYSAFDKVQLQSFFTSVCKFNNLNELELDFDTSDEIRETIDGYLIVISRNNPNLKRFKLSLYTNSLVMDRLFYAFEGFQNLIHLKVGLIYYNQIIKINGSVKCFEPLTKLKTLEISYADIDESFFEDIHKYLPNLSTLLIECESEITDQTVFRLSHLKKLKKFALNRFHDCNEGITDDSVCALINSCPLLEKLSFASRPKITNKTIETLIDCLTNNPKRCLTFYCGVSHNGNENQFPTIDLDSYHNKIPHNLNIQILIN